MGVGKFTDALIEMTLHKIGSLVCLNQGDTKSKWLVADVASHQEGQMVHVVHEDELGCAGNWMPADCFHEAEVNNKDRALILSAFAQTRRGKELIKELM